MPAPMESYQHGEEAVVVRGNDDRTKDNRSLCALFGLGLMMLLVAAHATIATVSSGSIPQAGELGLNNLFSTSMVATPITPPRLLYAKTKSTTKKTIPGATYRSRKGVLLGVPSAVKMEVGKIDTPQENLLNRALLPKKHQMERIDALLADETQERGNLDTETLILLTKAFFHDFLYDPVEFPWRLANDFKFLAPVVGPLDRLTFLDSFANFKVQEAFPNMEHNLYHFRRDPFEYNRIWFTTRPRGKNTGPWFGGALPPSNVEVDQTPQTMSVEFNDFGKATRFTVGYSMDRELGNSGGLGGIFGLLFASGYGLPFKEGQPYRPSRRYRAFQAAGATAKKINKTGKTIQGVKTLVTGPI